MNQVVVIMMALIRSVICDEPVDKKIIKQFTPEVLKELYSLSKAHDVAHLVAYALKREKIIGTDFVSSLFSKSFYVAVARYAKIVSEQNKICDLFERSQIVYVPLKGAIIRDYYPEPWMRTSCDIDILIKEEDIESAKKMLIQELGYRMKRNNYHDISLYSESDIHLELHFSILENEKKIDRMLQQVWGHLINVEGYSFRMVMESAYFVFHQVAHAMYHFVHGGCGIRLLIDLWLIETKVSYDREEFYAYCEASGLLTFASELRTIAEVWFGEGIHTELSRRMEEYILFGGVYGNEQSSMAAERSRMKGTSRWRYWVNRVFIPYAILKNHDELLKKYPVLYPYYQVKRWFKLLNPESRKNIVKEIVVSQSLEQETVDKVKGLFCELGL